MQKGVLTPGRSDIVGAAKEWKNMEAKKKCGPMQAM